MHPATVFGKLYRVVKSRERDPGFESIRDIFRDEAINRLPCGSGDEVFGPVSERKWHSVSTAAKTHGLKMTEVRTLFRAGGLLPMKPGDDQKYALVEASSADALLENVKSALSFGQARDCLHMNIEHLRAVIDLGWLKPLLSLRDGGHVVPYFTRIELERFQTELRDRVTVDLVSPRMTSIGDAAKRAGCTVKDVINLLFEGKLVTVGWRCEALLVDAAEVGEKIASR
ncbi:hypothetical protein [Sinorhizobium sp. NFACC03]|uniref:hypothetical protein n=1 Tax=Sinorhizobium sp. NFACC03 TaxID=1566295 RepID=UPI00088BB626|nr:hypothetical protein [Sinorhizobium sp. NFACC03]SDA61508.1 hypothetical protein SAMN03159448_01721 [Sinorhizobium sp. NFACC03]